MKQIVPAVLAENMAEFERQLSAVNFAPRIHIDFMDGSLTDSKSISIKEANFPPNKILDLHVMSDKPQDYLDEYRRIKPNMVIVQADSHSDIVKLATDLRENGIKTGLCVLPETVPQKVNYILPHIQQVLIFSGHLGHFGGQANLSLLEKIDIYRNLHHYLEFGWDGGANDQNVAQIAEAGVDVINVGGFIQNADNPEAAFRTLEKNIH